MKRKLLGYLLVFAAFTGVFSSCIDEEFEELGDAGKTYVKVLGEREQNLYFSPFDEVRKIDLFSIRRDANTSGALNQNATVKLVAAPELITEYNTENKEDYELLPAELYTLAENSSIVPTSDGYTFNYGSGEFAKELTILLDGSKWDLSKKFAVAFRVTDAGGLPIASGQDEIIVLISIKNKFDAIYTIDPETSSIVDANGLYEDDYPRDIALATRTSNSVLYFDMSYNYPNLIVNSIATGGAANTGIRPIYTFDPETGDLVSVADANNATRVFTDVEGKFNEATRSIYIKWTAGRWTVTENYVFSKER